MYPVSSGYKQAIESPVRPDQALSGTITLVDNSTIAITNASIVANSVVLDSQCVSGEDIGVGCVSAAQLTMGLLTPPSNPYALDGARISLSYGIVIGKDVEDLPVWEWVPLGVFYVTEIQRKANHVLLTALDGMIRFDIPVGTTDVSGRPDFVLENCCAAAGVTLSSAQLTSFPNYDRIISFDDMENVQTLRDVIMWICQLLCCFVRITRTGQLELVRLHSAAVKNIPASMRYPTTSVSDTLVHITRIAMKVGTQEYSAGAGDSSMTLTENPCLSGMSASGIQEILENIWTEIAQVQYVPADINLNGDPALMPGDYLVLESTASLSGNPISLITHSTWHFRGQHKIRSAGKAALLRKEYSQTQKAISAINNIARAAKLLATSANDSTQLISDAVGGNVLIRKIAGGTNEILIMDNPDPEAAVRIWRWNMGGLGYSDNTTGVDSPAREYTIAMTMDGVLTANIVKLGILAALNNASWLNMETGTFSLGNGAIAFDGTDINFILASGAFAVRAENVSIAIVDVNDAEVTRASIDANGVSAERMTADEAHFGPIYLDNTAPTIPGNRAMRLPPGTYNIAVYPGQPTGYAYWDNGITSLQQALDMLPKWLDGATVNIILHYSPIYGDVTIAGFWGNGSLTITTREDFVPTYGRANVGAVQISDCSARVAINYVAAKQISAENAPHITARGCAINVSGGTGILVNAGAYVHALLCEINAGIGIRCRYSGSALSNDNKGDCTTAARADYGGHTSLIGARSYGALYTEYAGIITDSGSTPTHGSGYVPPPVPPQTTVQIAVSTSRSRKGTQWYGDGSDTTVGYGNYESTGQWYGCMTFAGLSALAGKTVLSARLQYTRRNGVGSSSAEAITVYSYSAPATLPTASWATGSAVTLVGNGKATAGVPRGVATWLDVNASDVQAIINGTAVGLALYTGSTGYGKGDGAGAANAPILEVTYQ